MYMEEPSQSVWTVIKLHINIYIIYLYVYLCKCNIRIYRYAYKIHIIYYVLLYTNVRGLFSRIISNATWNNDGRGRVPETKEKLKTWATTTRRSVQHRIYCSDFLRLLSMNIKMGSLEPSNNEYAWARLLDIFTLGSYKKKKSPTKLRIVLIISVAGWGGSNSLVMCISYRHWWNYNFTILSYLYDLFSYKLSV